MTNQTNTDAATRRQTVPGTSRPVEPGLSRRAMITGMGTALTTAALGAVIVPAMANATVASTEPVSFDLQGWLDTAPVQAVVLYHMSQMTEALQRQHGGLWQGSITSDSKVAIAAQVDPRGDGVYILPRGQATDRHDGRA